MQRTRHAPKVCEELTSCLCPRIGGRAQHREFLRRNNYIEVGNDYVTPGREELSRADRIADIRRALRDRHGITVAGGQGELTGRILRIGAFGAIEAGDIVRGLAALEVELLQAGQVLELGAGVGAFSRAYAA